MSLADDLLGVAREMAESTLPNWEQARLRRAVSTTYYALFHFLLEQASAQIVGDPKIQTLVSRGFAHTDIQKAAITFRSGWGALPDHIRAVFSNPLPPEIVQLSITFISLQQARQNADYNLLTQFVQSEVVKLVSNAEKAIADFRTLQANPAAKTADDLFLASLLLIDRWKK